MGREILKEITDEIRVDFGGRSFQRGSSKMGHPWTGENLFPYNSTWDFRERIQIRKAWFL